MLGDQSACLIPSSPVLVVASVSVSTKTLWDCEPAKNWLLFLMEIDKIVCHCHFKTGGDPFLSA